MLNDPNISFHWSDRTRLVIRGCDLDGVRPARDRLERDLAGLRDAVRTNAEFAVTGSGITVVQEGPVPAQHFSVQSGGTTGRAKTVRRTHMSWISSFEVNRTNLGLGEDDIYAILGAPSHSLALYAILEAAHLGAGIHMLAGMTPRRQAELLADTGATVAYGTPTQLGLLAETGAMFPRLRHLLCGGGRMPAGLRRQLRSIAPKAVLTEFYGAAETSFIAWGGDDRPDGSVGRAYPGVDIRIDAPAGSAGKIWVASPYLFDGYGEGGSGDTRRDGRFLTVGEIGRMDPDGNLFIIGRKSRMVTIADQNVFPEDIETFLLADPEVTHCAVVPAEDVRRGAVLLAVVSGDLPVQSKERLLRQCRETFGPLAAPRQVLCLEDFPLTAAGKPDLARISSLIGSKR